MRTFILNWYGPYTNDEVVADRESGNGLYLFTGKVKYQRSSEILYCGITEDTFRNRLLKHHKKDEVYKGPVYMAG
jgi:hypothetical protein